MVLGNPHYGHPSLFGEDGVELDVSEPRTSARPTAARSLTVMLPGAPRVSGFRFRIHLHLTRVAQQPVASRITWQASAIRTGPSWVTRRRNADRGRVWRLSKLATQTVGTPSASGVNSKSDTTPRLVRVSAATTTEPMRSATGSRVRISTGRSPPGVAANQTSPRCIGPIRPILGGTPVCDLGQGRLIVGQRGSPPCGYVLLGSKSHQVPM